jgi:hypothetical protein
LGAAVSVWLPPSDRERRTRLMTCQDYNVSWTEIVSCVAPSLSEFDDVRLTLFFTATPSFSAQSLAELLASSWAKGLLSG